MNSRARLKRNVAIAVIGGAIVGGAAGFWSPRHQARAQAPAGAAIVEPVQVPTQVEAVSPLPPPAEKPQPGVLARARDMAEHGDVPALLALRHEIVRSTQSGQSDPSATQRELEEVDRYVTAARQRRLKIDGEALQKSTAAGSGSQD